MELQEWGRIILVGGDKGGVGKSTTAAMLAACCATRWPTTLIDTDIHRDTYSWAAARARDFPHLPKVRARHELEGIGEIACREAEEGRRVVLDVGGRDAELLRVAMSVAHVMILPVCPSQLDLFSCKRMARRVAEVRRWNPLLGAHFFVNRAETNWVLRHVNEEALEVCRTFEPIIGTAETMWHRRMIYMRSMSDGTATHEREDAGHAQAAEEVWALASEVIPSFDDHDEEEECHGIQDRAG